MHKSKKILRKLVLVLVLPILIFVACYNGEYNPLTGVEFTQVSAGEAHSLAVCTDGRVWAWGRVEWGLEHGGWRNDYRPQMLAGFAPVNTVSAGGAFSMALDRVGRIWTWGDGDYGKLGHGRVEGEELPRRLSGVGNPILDEAGNEVSSNIIAISAGTTHSMALCGNGYIWTWGNGANGRLGHGGIADEHRPRRVMQGIDAVGLASVRAVSAGYRTSIAVDGQGNVWHWGVICEISEWQINDSPRPQRISGLSNIIAVCYGVALCEDGYVWTWENLQPRRISGLSNIAYISNGLAIDNNGQVWMFGDNIQSAVVQGIENADMASTGGSHVMVLDDYGQIWTWGNGTNGQLGHGGTATENHPRAVNVVN